jgi:hypothetical protein
MLASGVSPRDDPRSNANALTTFWKVVLASRAPIAGLRMTMRIDGNGKETGRRKSANEAAMEGFVDVVAKGGEEWIRIYR